MTHTESRRPSLRGSTALVALTVGAIVTAIALIAALLTLNKMTEAFE